MKLWHYVKDRIIIILLNLTGIYLISLFLIMLQNQITAVVLIDVAWTFVLVVVMGYDFYIRKNHFKKVESILEKLDKPYLISEVAPIRTHIEDEIYHDLLRRSNKSVIDAINKKEAEQEDYRNFIESWIHEIKTPITSLTLMCENQNMPSEQVKIELQRIEQQVDMVLYYARLENANQDYFIHPYDLRRIVSESIQKNRTYLRQQQAQVEVDMDETIVSTDDKWIKFILTQFIINSIKYKSKEFLRLHFWCEKKSEQVILHMKDNGLGIAREELDKIFEKGYTGTNGRKIHHSTGMGLYLCKRLCDKLGIGIRCASKMGEFTRMSLIFPDSTYYKGIED